MALAGGLHARTHGDMPVKGHDLTLHEASCPCAEPQTGTRAPTCPDVSPGEAAGSTGDASWCCFGTLSLEHSSCAWGRILAQGRDFAATLGLALPSKELSSKAGLGGQEGPSGLPGHLWALCPPWAPAMLLSPQMAMLLKLQEAANYIESPDRETMVDPDLQSTL